MRTNTAANSAVRPINDDPSSTDGAMYLDRSETAVQYSLSKILAAWAAAAAPMAVLAWLVAPWLGHRLGGRDPFLEALMICFNLGLIWQLVLVLILVRREHGELRWSRVCDTLGLRTPRNPKTRRIGGRVWWWVLPFVVVTGVVNAIGIDPTGPLPRDLPKTLELDRVRLEHFFRGNWYGFALLAAVAILAPIVEELFFRGLLLPRMRAVFGKRDCVANGVLFGIYHLHQPWSIPASVIDGFANQAYPTRRFRSTWIGIITHTAPSFIIIGVVLSLVL